MNNHTTILPAGACPKAEELSSLHDGMTLVAIAEHAAACPRCQAILAAYAKLDVMIGQTVAPSADLAAKIKARCLKESRTPQKALVMWPKENAWKLGAAAAATLAVGGLLMVYTGESGNLRTANQLAAAHTDELSNNAVMSSATPALADTRFNILPAAGSNGTNASVRTTMKIGAANTADNANAPFRTVGVSAGPGNDAVGTTTFPAIGDAVQHVWVVKDVKEATDLFRQCMPRHHSQITDVSANGQVMFRVVVSDRDMQSFVNRLNNAGLSLVSPALPQPESGQPLQILGKPVLYTVELVPSENP